MKVYVCYFIQYEGNSKPIAVFNKEDEAEKWVDDNDDFYTATFIELEIE